MCTGMFEICAKYVYIGRPVVYGPRCEISEPAHAPGVAIESYLCSMFPTLRPSPAGTFYPSFMHCDGFVIRAESNTGSTRNYKECLAALDFPADLVQNTHVKISPLAVIAPYLFNAAIINRKSKTSRVPDVEWDASRLQRQQFRAPGSRCSCRRDGYSERLWPWAHPQDEATPHHAQST